MVGQSDMSTDPVKLYWWNDKPNFGDALSAGVVGHLSGRDVVWSREADSDLFAIGSILHRTKRIPKASHKPVIWGSGIMKPVRDDIRDVVEIAAVRGPLTASFLNLRDVPMGDPGLFAADIEPAPAERRWRVGVIPHYSHKRHLPATQFADLDDVLYIDADTNDYGAVLRQIAACDAILSSSLHGLIVADSYGIPNQWIDPFAIADHGRMKFYDYALAIDRLLPTPVPPEALFDTIVAIRQSGLPEITYMDGVARAKSMLRGAFPG